MIEEFSRILGINIRVRRRYPEYSWARYCAYFTLWMYGNSISDIAKWFGYDHASVSCGIKSFTEKLIIGDSVAVELITKIENCMVIKIYKVARVVSNPVKTNGLWVVSVLAEWGSMIESFDLSYTYEPEAKKVTPGSLFYVEQV